VAAAVVDQLRLRFRVDRAAVDADIAQPRAVLHLRRDKEMLAVMVTQITISQAQAAAVDHQRQEITPQMQMVQKVGTELLTSEQFMQAAAVARLDFLLGLVARQVRAAQRLECQVRQARQIAAVDRAAEVNTIQAVMAEAELLSFVIQDRRWTDGTLGRIRRNK
jgi:hypothetical protein